MARAAAIFHNWKLKASALALSVFLWALVQSEPTGLEIFDAVPVRVEVGDTAWTVSGALSPATVELRLAGPAREIIRLARDGVTVRVPVGVVGSPDSVITLRREWVELGDRSAVTVESVSPTSIQVAFEPAVTRLIPVSARIEGRVRRDLALATPVGVSPALVRVRGPESSLSVLDSLPLAPFELDQVATSGIYTVALDTAGLSIASVVPPTASLSVSVESAVQRVFDEVTVEAEAEPGRPPITLEPESIRLTLTGAQTVVSSLDPDQLRVWVPAEFLQGMEPDEERRVRVLVQGVPALVTAVPATEVVTVRRTTGAEGG